MRKSLTVKRLLLFLTLVALVALPLMTLAQESSPETSGEAAATTETAAESDGGVSPLEPLGINAGYLLSQIINFLIIFGALTLLLWRPIINMLDARSVRIEKGLEDAAVAANARRNAEAEAEKIRAEARAEVARAIEEGRARGDEVRKQIEADARNEAERIRTEARTAAAAERDQQLSGLRGQVAAISIAAAQKLIGEALDSKRQQALVDDFFSRVPEAARKLGGSVEVVSAMPLSEAEQKKARHELGADEVVFTVDPGILGGLVVRAGDRVVDGSVRSGLSELANRLS